MRYPALLVRGLRLAVCVLLAAAAGASAQTGEAEPCGHPEMDALIAAVAREAFAAGNVAERLPALESTLAFLNGTGHDLAVARDATAKAKAALAAKDAAGAAAHAGRAFEALHGLYLGRDVAGRAMQAGTVRSSGFGSSVPTGPLNARVLGREDAGGYTREWIAFDSDPGVRVTGLLLLPKKVRFPAPAVLCLHGHNWEFQLGKSQLCGLAGDPALAYAEEMVNAGYIALAIDTFGFEERFVEEGAGLSGKAYQDVMHAAAQKTGVPWGLRCIRDDVRAVDYLLSRPEVDGDRIGVTGISMGGIGTAFTAALHPRVAASVIVMGLPAPNPLPVIHPRPCLVVVGTRDRVFDLPLMRREYAHAKKLYQESGDGERLAWLALDSNHEMRYEIRRRTVQWFDRWLRGADAGRTTAQLLASPVATEMPPVERARKWQLRQYGYRPPRSGFRCRAFWGGGIFSANYGPWDRGLALSLDPAVEWRRTIDWCADQGIDTLISGAAWGNMRELLLFEKHPEARSVPEETIRSNRAHVNALLAYARSKGVRMLFHSYNLHAPQKFVDAHPEIRRKKDAYVGVSLRKGGYADNLCWRDPLYRAFLTDCWDELFRVCPDLGGLHLTVGEANKCDHCLPEIDAVSRDFLETFSATVRRHGRQGWVRTWHFREFPTQHPDVQPAPILNVHTHPERYVPDDLVYVMKYSHTDCVDVEPDPGVVEAWKARGKTLLLHLSLYGENSGAMRWTSPRLQSRLVERARRAGADGIVIGSQNTGSEGCRYAPYWMNPLALVYYAGRRVPYAAGMWEDYLSAFFPRAEKETLSILDRWAEAALSLPRIYGQSQEGFTWGWGYASSRIGTAGWDPPFWWQKGLLGAYEFGEHVKAKGYDPDAVAKLAAGRTLFSDQALADFRRIDGAFADLERLRAASPEARTRAGLWALRSDLLAWRLFQFQSAWIFRHKMLTTALAGAAGEEVKDGLRRDLDAWYRVLGAYALEGRVGLEPSADIPPEVLTRLERAVSAGAGPTVGTAFVTDLRQGRDRIVRGYQVLPDGALQVPALWMEIEGEGLGGYCVDGEFLKIGPPGKFDIAPGTRATARWVFSGEPGRYAITVCFKDDKDDAGRGAKSLLSVDGKTVLEWGYDLDDDQVHEARGEADLRTGSVLRIDSVTETGVPVSAEYCRIQGLTLKRR